MSSRHQQPKYVQLLRNILDVLVSQSAVIWAAIYIEYNSQQRRYVIKASSLAKKGPRVPRRFLALLQRDAVGVYVPIGLGFLRDQVLEDGVTRIILDLQRVYQLNEGKLVEEFPHLLIEKNKLEPFGIKNYLSISTRVPRSDEESLDIGYVVLPLLTELAEVDWEKHIPAFQRCEDLVHGPMAQVISETHGGRREVETSARDMFPSRTPWLRRRTILLITLGVMISLAAVGLSLTVMLPVVANLNPNVVTVLVGLAEVAVAIVGLLASRRHDSRNS